MEFSSSQLLEKLLSWIAVEKNVDIRYDFTDNDGWSVICKYEYSPDSEIAIRLYTDEHLDLFYGYYDANDEFIEMARPLTAEEIATLPSSLIKIMKKVLADEEGMRVPGTFLLL